MPSSRDATIVGTVQGVVQGDHNTVTLNYDYRGAIVNLLQREPTAPRRLPPPVNVLPAPFPALLDRTGPVADTFEGLAAGLPIEVSGPPGMGKSALLRYLCRRPEVARFDGGVVFRAQRREPVDDLLQFLFAACYDAESGYKPVGARLLRYLQDINALVVLDDLSMDQEDLETLRNSAPSCTFVMATERIQLLEARAITLGGLPEEAIPALVVRGLGRSLAAEELPAVRLLNRALGGNPGHLLQATVLVRQGSTTLSDLAARLGSGRGATDLAWEAISKASPAERRVLRTIAALGDVPVRAGHVEALSGVLDAATTLESLRERQLVQVQNHTYSVADNVGAALQAEADRVGRSTAVVDHLTRWIESPEGASPLADRDLVMAAIGWAGEASRSQEVLRLCRGIEGALMAAGMWGEWQLVLEHAAVAARELSDPLALGWALHQLGTLALCRENYGAAQSLLGQALAVRERTGDAEGAMVTRHNLDVLARLTAPPGPDPPPSTVARMLGWKLLLLIPLLGLVGLTGFLVARPPTQAPGPQDPAARVTATPPLPGGTGPSATVTGPTHSAPPPAVADFALAVDSPTQEVDQGATAEFQVAIQPANGFGGSVALAVTGAPKGGSASFNPAATSTGSVLSVVTLPSTPAGSSKLTITGTSGDQKHATTVTLSVKAPVPDFSLEVTPASQTIEVPARAQNADASVTVTIRPSSGFNQPVKLSLDKLPVDGSEAVFQPNPAITASTLTVQPLPPGTYTLPITGVSGNLSRHGMATVIVKAPAAADFSLSATPQVSLNQRQTAGGYQITITPMPRLDGAVSLAVQGLPSGVQSSFSANPTTTSSTLTVTITYDCSLSSTLQPYTITIVGTSGNVSHSVASQLVISCVSRIS